MFDVKKIGGRLVRAGVPMEEAFELVRANGEDGQTDIYAERVSGGEPMVLVWRERADPDAPVVIQARVPDASA